MTDKIKVVWVCSFSNEEIRKHYSIKINPVLKWILQKRGKMPNFADDTAKWNTNAIKEFEKFTEVDLHIISPIRYLEKKEIRFQLNGIKYYFFREENSDLFSQLFYQTINKYNAKFFKNRKKIKKIIRGIEPKIVHVIGAENPYYATAMLDLDNNTTNIIQLQALLDRLVLVTNNPLQKKDFAYKGLIERSIINKADYVGTTVQVFKDYIKKEINPNAKFIDISIAMGNRINLAKEEKKYDFVYFAANINKAGDEAIKAFAIAQKKHPQITLNIIGGFDNDFKAKLDKIIHDNGIEKAVFFEGKLPTYNDVIRQIRQSKFALLPLKMDLVPSTVREAISNGLPVITTITENGTDTLNNKRESVLLSQQDDDMAMAENMIRLIENPDDAELIKNNAILTETENFNNSIAMQNWLVAYKKIVGSL